MNPQGDPIHAATHLEEAQKLQADGYLDLFRIRMTPQAQAAITLNLSSRNTVTWQGTTWEGYPIHLADYSRNSMGEQSRPKFSMANPAGEFTRYAHQGYLNGAEVRRYRVLGQHLTADVNSYLLNTWRYGRVITLSPSVIVIELRGVLDGQAFVLPGRTFIPPEFPSVSI